MPKGSRRKKTRKLIDIPANLVDKRKPKSKAELNESAKEYVKKNKSKLFKVQKTKRILKKKEKKILKRRVFESEQEKKIVSRFSKKIKAKKNQTVQNQEVSQELKLKNNLTDPWEEQDETKFKSKWEDKPLLPQHEKARNPAIMVPKSGESHNPSQGAYSTLVDTLFDKGNFFIIFLQLIIFNRKWFLL